MTASIQFFTERGMQLRTMSCAVGLLMLVGHTAILPGEPDKEREAGRIARLIEQLGDDEFAKRQQASKALEAIGTPALTALRKAAGSIDLEIRHRAERLVKRLVARLQLRRFEGHTDGVIATALTPDGKRALSGPVCY